MELAGTDIVAVTNAQGEFSMRGLIPGSKLLVARHLGFSRAGCRGRSVVARRKTSDDQAPEIRGDDGSGARNGAQIGGPRQSRLQSAAENRVRLLYRSGPTREHAPQLRHRYPEAGAGTSRELGPSGEMVSSSRVVGEWLRVQYYVDGMFVSGAGACEITSHFVNGSEVVAVEVYQDANAPANTCAAGSWPRSSSGLDSRFTS